MILALRTRQFLLALLLIFAVSATVPAENASNVPSGAAAVTAQQVERLVAQLANEKAAEREAAQKELIGLGAEVLPLLKKYRESDDPEVSDRVARIFQAFEEKTWGEAVQGVQVRLRAAKREWKFGETPKLLADVRNKGTQEMRMIQGQNGGELEFDGTWYQCTQQSEANRSNVLATGQQFNDFVFKLINHGWAALRSSPRITELNLAVGKHTIRASFLVIPSGGYYGPPRNRAISNAVEIEILPAKPKPAAPPTSANVPSGAPATVPGSAKPPEAGN